MKNLYLSLLVTLMVGLSGSAQCITNGNFENGLAGLSAYTFSTFSTGTYSYADCHVDTSVPSFINLVPSPTVNNLVSKGVTLVSTASLGGIGINDPSVATTGANPSLPRVQPGTGGNFAIKLNNDESSTADIVTMSTNFTAASSVVSFDFALVFRLHGGTDLDIEPFFTARIYDMNGVIVNTNEICYRANTDNNIFNFASPNLLYTTWECARLEIPQNLVGQPLRLEFVVADCGASGHVGSVYLDNIRCDARCTPAFGSLTLDQFNVTCPSVPFNVCGKFTAPRNSTYVANSLTLEIFDQNDNFVTTVPSTPTITGNTFCFSVDPSLLVSLGGSFEFRANANFAGPTLIYNLFDASSSPGPDLTFVVIDAQSTTITAGMLDWADVADSYKLEFVADNNCCPTRIDPNKDRYYSVTITESKFNLWDAITALQAKCFRWRIKASCGGWSEWCCLSGAEAYQFPEQFGNPIAPNCYNGEISCLESLHQTVDAGSGTISLIQRKLFITAVNKIFNDARAVYQAGRFIELQPGFGAVAGAVFLAEIEDCSPALTSTSAKTKNNFTSAEREIMQNNIVEKTTKFMVYPNPTDGVMTIVSEVNVDVYTIIDITGKELMRVNNAQNKETQMNVSGLSQGIYFLTADGASVQKIIKK